VIGAMRLRAWGTDTIRQLPPPRTNEWTNEWTIGAVQACALQLAGPTGCISRLHARLVRDGAK
jgi:hypothetical protein